MGTVQPTFWLQLPQIPRIIDEWAALIPLAVYLSSGRSDYELAGEVTLRRMLSVSAIPKLWALGRIAKMLRQGDLFFDRASEAGDLLKIYDVQWGSVFPCYNSAAALAVEENAFSRQGPRRDISREELDRWILNNQGELLDQFTLSNEPKDQTGGACDMLYGSDIKGLVQHKRLFGRRQMLKVIVISPAEARFSATKRLQKLLRTGYWKGLELLLMVTLAGFLLSCGLFGSGSLLLIGSISRFCLYTVKFDRSPRYLRTREAYEGRMLATPHENATAWTLYVGHRGLIDSLLNKPMIEPGKAHPLVIFYFRFAEIFQVLAMTYVAGQKGWDGVAFVILMIVMWIFTGVSGNNKHAAQWLEEEGFAVDGFTCEFPGRTELLGAVQLLSLEKKTYWMDNILAPVPRREVWLRKIGAVDSDSAQTERDLQSLSDLDKTWVSATGIQSVAGCRVIQERLRRTAAGFSNVSEA